MDLDSLRAERGIPFGQDIEGQEVISDTIRYFFSKYKYLYEERIAHLIFYADYRHYQEHSEQLTGAQYESRVFGVWSDEIHVEMKELDLTYYTVYRSGQKTKKYTDAPDGAFTNTDTDFLDKIHAETREIPTDKLVRFALSLPMCEAVSHGERMEFSVDSGPTGL